MYIDSVTCTLERVQLCISKFAVRYWVSLRLHLFGSTTQIRPATEPSLPGDDFWVNAIVKPDTYADLTLARVELWIDDVAVASTFLVQDGSVAGERYRNATTLNMKRPSVGEHTAYVKFLGFQSGDPKTPSVLESTSKPVTLTVGPYSPGIDIESAPSEVDAYSPIDVTASIGFAKVSSPAPTGTATLMVDNTEVATSPVQPKGPSSLGGTVQFTGVRLPAAGSTLKVKYSGSTDGNYAPSEPGPRRIAILPLDTSVSFALDPAEIRADATTQLEITVTNNNQDSSRDPVGGIEIFIDGNSHLTITQAQDEDLQAGNGVSRFSVPLGGTALGLGTRDISVNFLAEPGFRASSSQASTLTVLGVPTLLKTNVTSVKGTPSHPPVVSVQAATDTGSATATFLAPAAHPAPDHAAAPATGATVAGYVQAFVGTESLGDPVQLTDGAANVTIAGLALGLNTVELRFTPTDDPNTLGASTTITAVMSADATPDPTPVDPDSTPTPDSTSKPQPAPVKPAPTTTSGLAQTGASGSQASLALGTGAALLAGAGLAHFASLRRGTRYRA